tara:strand:+ start:366 stop:587 length:222 start_codon:yes stop_codon:yes gene_type:complete
MNNKNHDKNHERNSRLVLIEKGIYMNAVGGGKRVRLDCETPGLIIDNLGSYKKVAVGENQIVLVHEKNCEQTQ